MKMRPFLTTFLRAGLRKWQKFRIVVSSGMRAFLSLRIAVRVPVLEESDRLRLFDHPRQGPCGSWVIRKVRTLKSKIIRGRLDLAKSVLLMGSKNSLPELSTTNTKDKA